MSGDVDPDIILLQETWLTEEITDDLIKIPNYLIFRADRNHSSRTRGGGAMIYARSNMSRKYEVVKRLSNDDLDLIIIKQENKTVIASVYINIAYNMSSAVETLSREVLDPFMEQYKIYIGGDFNHAPVNTPFNLSGLTNIVKFPTRGESFLDQIWTNVSENELLVEKYAKLADHNFVKCTDKYRKFSRPRKWRKKHISELNKEQLQCELENTLWDQFTEMDNLDQKTEAITAYINFCEQLCTSHFVYYEDEVTGDTTTSEIKHARRRRERAFKNGNDDDFKYWSGIVQSGISALHGKLLVRLRKQNAKNYWENIKNISGFRKKEESTRLSDNIKVDDLNDFFLRFEKDEKLVCPTVNLEMNKAQCLPSLLDEKSTVSLMKKAKNAHSRGHDGLSSSVLRNFRNELKTPINNILNECIKHSKIPRIWKYVKITPIPKGNFTLITEAKQMRPVGQTPSMLKLLEYHIKTNLAFINDDLDKYQFAYKDHVSTIDAIAVLTGECSKAMDNPGTFARGLFLDYSSAFNTVSRQKILDILAINAPAWLLQLMTEYLDVRYQYVKYAGKVSTKLPCRTGVVQGAVLSPLLFTLITDSLRTNHESSKIIKFADDTAIIHFIHSTECTINYEHQIRKVEDFSKEEGLILNARKTNEVIFANKRLHRDNMKERIKIGNEIVEPISVVKYLGIFIDSSLTFDHQIKTCIQRATQRLKYAQKLLVKCNQAVVAKDFVTQCIIPIITYALHVYIHYVNKERLKELQRFLRRLASICRVPKSHFIEMVERQINIQSFNLYERAKNNTAHPLNSIYTVGINSNYQTRNGATLPKTRSAIAQKCFIYQAIKSNSIGKPFFEFG